jgi:hypothetical protein
MSCWETLRILLISINYKSQNQTVTIEGPSQWATVRKETGRNDNLHAWLAQWSSKVTSQTNSATLSCPQLQISGLETWPQPSRAPMWMCSPVSNQLSALSQFSDRFRVLSHHQDTLKGLRGSMYDPCTPHQVLEGKREISHTHTSHSSNIKPWNGMQCIGFSG